MKEDERYETESSKGICFFQRYLTFWVIICMTLGILIGKCLPGIPEFLNRFEYARISIPMAILIWLMIYPMMMKVDFQSIRNVGKNPKGFFVTWITNWLIRPFTMYSMQTRAFVSSFRPDFPALALKKFGVISYSCGGKSAQ